MDAMSDDFLVRFGVNEVYRALKLTAKALQRQDFWSKGRVIVFQPPFFRASFLVLQHLILYCLGRPIRNNLQPPVLTCSSCGVLGSEPPPKMAQ